MNRAIRNKLIAFAIVFLNILFTPVMALAQEESKMYDARLEGYARGVTLEGGSTALLWLLLIVLCAIVVGVMMKNANRSHLD